MTGTRPRLVAFYLPQFHPIPENDEWWGKGFTEWVNVTKAKRLFKGHCQPHLPADLGFYDLRVPEVREAQAELAEEAGIEGFCYWHYWFAGKRLLERPLNDVLASGRPDLPFCLAWANQTWSGIWHGDPEKILIEQTYPGQEDSEAHFYAVLGAFQDARYMKVDDRPVFVVFRPTEIPNVEQFIGCWQELATRNGLSGVYFAGLAWPRWPAKESGFDAGIIDNPGVGFGRLDSRHRRWERSLPRFVKRLNEHYLPLKRQLPRRYSYEQFVQDALPTPAADFDQYPCVVPNWDNTPRSGRSGRVLLNSTPEAYRRFLRGAISQVEGRRHDKRLVFIKSWNEWAEGNYLEPDTQYGRQYLQVTRDESLDSQK